MFNFGPGEIVLLGVLTLLLLGKERLPDLVKHLGESLQNPAPPRLLLQRRGPRRWSFSDWALLFAAVGLAAAVIANVAMRR